VNLLRRLSTTRLIILLTAVVAIAVAAAAVTMAARADSTKPPKRSLPAAVQHALSAKLPAGVTARIKFTNRLFSSAALPDTGSTVVTGASGRLWASKGHLRLELQSTSGDSQLILTKAGATLYDAATNSVYKLPFPAGARTHESGGSPEHQGGVPGVSEISKLLARIGASANVSGAKPSNVAGQPAYTVRISPKHDGGLLGAAELAWDSNRGVPLRIAIYSSTDRSPVLELKVTDISYGAISPSVFQLNPPAGATTTTLEIPSAKDLAHAKPTTTAAGPQVRAPHSLVGLPRQFARTIRSDKGQASVVVYGRGLGAIAVIERPGAGAKNQTGPLGALPSVSINGSSGHELSTPLGTVLTWQRGGVSYTLIGSIPASAAEAAARELTP
jgi:outer membrane lipoprotein-sorting protein